MELFRGCAMLFVGRLPLLPKPCGAWPESVTLPCAFQLRVELGTRLELFMVVAGRPPGCVAYGGRLAESCDMRFAFAPWGVGRAVFIALTLLCAAAPREEVLMVRTGMCAAAGAGEVRAMTLRF